MKLTEKLRWRIAGLIDKLPRQCWTELAMFGLGYRRLPWAPQDSVCRKDAARCGACYCGKLRRPEGLIPNHTGPGNCPTCAAQPGKTHELSCEQVTPKQALAFIDAIAGGAK